ncbi:MAG: L-rhamnose isomerase [Christensenellales bacterium]
MRNNVESNYFEARDIYAELGVDTDRALDSLQNKRISFNAWQLDDVKGFLNLKGKSGGGIQATGNYPGVARNAKELMQDAEKVFSLVGGKHKLSLQANMVDTDEKVDLDTVEPKHFAGYVEWAKRIGIGLDINPSCAGHPMLESGFTLSSSDSGIRDYWINHFVRTSEIGEYFGKETGVRCVTNYWIPDGYKDFPADTYSPRLRLKESLDKIFSRKRNTEYNIDTLESKLFGIGVEAYTVGSHEFYMAYAMKNGLPVCLDAGHFHLSEDIGYKISAVMFGCDEILLHVTRPMRWDSDHVVSYDDNVRNIMKEIVRGNFCDRVNLGTDYFDASINRIAAGVLGMRNTQKAYLYALLEPFGLLKKLEAEGNYTARLALTEECKTLPFDRVWNYFCLKNDIPSGYGWVSEVERYEREVLSKRQ